MAGTAPATLQWPEHFPRAARLLDTFEFYLMPVATFDSLDSPRFVRSWLEEARGGKRRIAVVEDAEPPRRDFLFGAGSMAAI